MHVNKEKCRHNHYLEGNAGIRVDPQVRSASRRVSKLEHQLFLWNPMHLSAVQYKSVCSLLRKTVLNPKKTAGSRLGPKTVRTTTLRLCNQQEHSAATRRLLSRSAVSEESMAANVLSHPHRFILVSDLDWTMVRDPGMLGSTCDAYRFKRHCVH